MFVIEVEDMSCLEVPPPEPALTLGGLGMPPLVNVCHVINVIHESIEKNVYTRHYICFVFMCTLR